jgi:hypothetical protein
MPAIKKDDWKSLFHVKSPQQLVANKNNNYDQLDSASNRIRVARNERTKIRATKTQMD